MRTETGIEKLDTPQRRSYKNLASIQVINSYLRKRAWGCEEARKFLNVIHEGALAAFDIASNVFVTFFMNFEKHINQK